MSSAHRIAVAVVLLSIPAVALAPAAHAHDRCVNREDNGGTLRGAACIKDFHNDLAGCDRYSDGLKVRAWYRVIQADDFPIEWDPNGANPGCGHAYAVSNWFAMRICVEQPIGCSDWVGI